MKIAPIPANELDRLENLVKLNVLDTEAEKAYDDLVLLASSITGCPISLISLVDSERQWFKARVGLDAKETPRDISFCGHAITEGNEIFEVSNANVDERFKDNPLVTGDPSISFYAGQPLTTSSGHNIGTLCVIDTKPKELNTLQKDQLKIIARLITSLFESALKVTKIKEDSLSKTAFVSSISHEIRTPLTAISGYIDVIEDETKESSSKDLKSAIQTIKENSIHLNSLVGDILDFSKLDARKMTTEKKPLSVRKLIKQVENLFKLQARSKNLKLDFHVGVSVPSRISGDVTHIKQILMNLVSNAVKFTEKGSISLTVGYDEDLESIFFNVKDTGSGMTAEELSRIFSPYEQANDKIYRNFKGTGLGMPISKELAELMGGKLSVVSSKKGVGSHFELKIPAPMYKAGTSGKKASSSRSRQVMNLSEIKKILVVDDVRENRFLLKHYLKGYDFTIDEASNAHEAEEIINPTYDVVFLDMNLPDMSGRDLFHKIALKSKNAKFVAFTASTHAEEKASYLGEGFSSFLSKPFDTKAIINAMTK